MKTTIHNPQGGDFEIADLIGMSFIIGFFSLFLFVPFYSEFDLQKAQKGISLNPQIKTLIDKSLNGEIGYSIKGDSVLYDNGEKRFPLDKNCDIYIDYQRKIKLEKQIQDQLTELKNKQ